MYKVTISFAMDNLRTYKQGEILAEDFTTQDEITDLLEAGYIIEYDGSLEITENGTYDVTEYETADVNVSGGTPTLQSKEVTITENGTQSITPDTGYDGLSGVSVTTNVSGADLSEYLNTTFTEDATGIYTNYLLKTVKKLDDVVITSNVTKLAHAFESGKNLTNITFSSNTNTSNVTDMSNLFNGNSSLKTINLSSFDTSNVANMAAIFSGCTNLSSVTFGNNFNTSSVTSMSIMFKNCSSLTNLDLSGFNTSNVIRTDEMFNGCTRLLKIDMRNFTFDNVINSSNMFGDSSTNRIPANCEIIVKSDTEKTWITSKFNWLTNIKTVAEYEA